MILCLFQFKHHNFYFLITPKGIKPQALERVKGEELRQLINLCIEHDPSIRPGARALLKHPFFDSLRMVRTYSFMHTQGSFMKSFA